MKRSFFIVRLLIAALLLVPAVQGGDGEIAELAKGKPGLVLTGKLPIESFVPFQAKRLAKASVVWVNWDYLAEKGVRFPSQGLTPEFEKELLDALAYMVPSNSDSKDDFTDAEKTFWADRYGGSRMGWNYGSGRAGTAGILQIKGIGRTPLVYDRGSNPEALTEGISSFSHSHGGASLREAMMEAVWGEILHRELPYGSNRVIAVISTGTHTKWIGPVKEPRGLIVREESLRPAHYVANYHAMNERNGTEIERVGKLFDRLVSVMPQPNSVKYSLQSNQWFAGYDEFIKRVAVSYAAEYAHSLYQGSSTLSNIELSGRAIDHGPMSALDGFTAATMSNGVPNGSIEVFLDDILFDFVEFMKSTAPPWATGPLEEKGTIRKKFIAAYDAQLARDFLWLAGAPPEWTEDLVKKPQVLAFSRHLREAAELGNEKSRASRYYIPRDTGRYRLPDLLAALHAGKSLEVSMPEESELARLLDRGFQLFLDQTSKIAKAKGVPQEGMRSYLRKAAELRNKPRVGIFRGPGLWLRMYQLIWEHRNSKDVSRLRQFIDDAIGGNSRAFPEESPYSLVLSETRVNGSPTVERVVFDAMTGETRTETRGMPKDCFKLALPKAVSISL